MLDLSSASYLLLKSVGISYSLVSCAKKCIGRGYHPLNLRMLCLKAWKAGDLSGILLQLVLCGTPVLLERLLVLMQAVWSDRCVFKDWGEALIMPVLKKGDLQICDNWRGSVFWMQLARFFELFRIACKS